MQIDQTLRELFWNPDMVNALPKLIVSLGIAALLGIILGQVYIHCGNSLSNRRSFARNFLILIVTTTLIISIVRSSLALSLGLVGALSIVRFRAAIKEPEELAFLFLAISVGLGLGAGQALITVAALAVIITIILVRRFFKKETSQSNLYLTITSPTSAKLGGERLLQLLHDVGASASLKRFDDDSQRIEAAFQVEFAQISQLEKFTESVRNICPEAKICCLDDKGLVG